MARLRYHKEKGEDIPLVNSAYIKFSVGFSLTIAALLLLQTDAVTNALLLFLTVGIVPGTSVVLSPEASFWAIAMLGTICLELIFRKELLSLFRRRKRAQQLTEHELYRVMTAPVPELQVAWNVAEPIVDTLIEPVAQPDVVPVRVAALESEPQPIPFVAVSLPHRPGRLVRAYLNVVAALPTWLAQLVFISVSIVALLGYKAEETVLWIGRAVTEAGLLTWRFMQLVWRQAEPHVKKLDAQIEQRVKQNENVMAFFHILEHSWRITVNLRHEFGDFISRWGTRA